ncbi:MAG: hypothetical protein KAQ64_04895 [Candidatus Pacebacteria bacterium]|nr:hypothetical protein [Candidatus Paceibacterota bacterium]
MKDDKKNSLEKYQEYWNIVDRALNEGTNSGYKMAIIETEKILLIVMSDKRIPGKSISEKIKNIEILLENTDKLNYSRAICEKLIKEPGFSVSADETREIVAGYYKAISDIIKMEFKDIAFKEKINFFLQRHFNQFPQKTKKWFILIFLFLLAVFISTETITGQFISEMISNLSQFVFYKLVPMILTIAVTGAVIVGGLYWWKNKK